MSGFSMGTEKNTHNYLERLLLPFPLHVNMKPVLYIYIILYIYNFYIYIYIIFIFIFIFIYFIYIFQPKQHMAMGETQE